MLDIRVFGHFAVSHREMGTPVVFPDETVRTLCKYLVLHRAQPVSPDVLMDVCWPQAEQPPRAALHAAVSRLRYCLEPGLQRGVDSLYLRRYRAGYAFADHIQLDLANFEEWAALAAACSARGDWTGTVQAVAAADALVLGELFACEPYADWAARARARFRQQYADTLEVGLEGHRRLSQWPAVIRLARRLLSLDNTRELAYRHLMEAFAESGEYGQALAAYDECRRTLALEAGTDPSPATQALYAEILGRTTPVAAAGTARAGTAGAGPAGGGPAGAPATARTDSGAAAQVPPGAPGVPAAPAGPGAPAAPAAPSDRTARTDPSPGGLSAPPHAPAAPRTPAPPRAASTPAAPRASAPPGAPVPPPAPAAPGAQTDAAPPRTPVASGLERLYRAALGSMALPLTGRTRQLEEISEFLSQGSLVVLQGDPGTGKSRLATEALTRLAGSGTLVLAASCQPAGRGLPHQPLADALGALWPDIDADTTPPGGFSGLRGITDSPRRVYAAAATNLLTAARRAPVILFLDDLHLSDADTIDFIRVLLPHLGRPPGAGQMAVIATARDAELRHHTPLLDLLSTAWRNGLLREVPVRPLSRRDVTALLRARAAESADRCRTLAAALHADSEGNALFIVERLRALLEARVIRRTTDGRWRWTDDLNLRQQGVPAAVADLARQRTADLQGPAAQLLQAAVVLDQPAPFAWLAAIVGAGHEAALASLEELLERRILLELQHEQGVTYTIGHHLIREALYQAMPAARRAYVHRQAADALAELAASDKRVAPALVADHYRQAGEDRLALDWHLRAAARARAAAGVTEAASHLAQALALAEALDEARLISRCAEDLAETLSGAHGWSDRVEGLFAKALEHAPTDEDAMRIWLRRGTAVLDVDPAAAETAAARALTLARSLMTNEHSYWALSLQAAARHRQGDADTAQSLASAAVAAFTRPTTSAAPRTVHAASDPLLAGYAVQYQAVWEAKRLLRSMDCLTGEMASCQYLADVAAFTARVPDTETRARQVLSLTETEETEHAFAQFCLTWVSFVRGGLDEAARSLRELIATATAGEWYGPLFSCQLLLAQVLADAGQADEAAEVLTAAQAVAAAHGDLRSQLLVRHAEAYVDWSRGDHLRAAACAEAALELGRDCLTPMDRIRLQHLLGLARLGLEDYAGALALSRDNLAAARACGTRLDEGLALGLKGQALLLLGRTAESRDALQAGAEVLGDLGAHHQRSRILNLLEAAGSRTGLSSSAGLNGSHVGPGQRGSSPGAGGSLAGRGGSPAGR